MTAVELRKMQLIQLDMLVDFDRVCRKHKIRYIISDGTLLGAIRNGGFIPWDDDIDIRMLRKDYERFASIANKELQKENFFQDHRTDPNYRWMYGKLRRQGTKAVRVGQEHIKMNSGVFVDIFPMDGYSENVILQKFQDIILIIARKILYSEIAKENTDSLYTKLFWNAINCIPPSVSYGIAHFVSIMCKYSKKVQCYGYHPCEGETGLKKEWFCELTQVNFEGKKFLAPKAYKELLEYYYGKDFMTPPPPELRTVSSPLSYYYLGK